LAATDAVTLTPHQSSALKKLTTFLLGKPGAFVLTGSAGTGKTTLLRHACAALEKRQREVQLLAPTGRAARVLADRTALSARTIHSHLYTPEPLKGRPGIRLVRKGLFAETPDVLIVDEASMISARRNQDDETFVAPAALLDDLMGEAERTGAHIVFVGDPCQLPPVLEDRSVALTPDALHDAYGVRVGHAHLSEVMRQADGSQVLAVATALRDRIEGAKPRIPRLRSIRWEDDAIDEYLAAVRDDAYDQATMLAFMNKSVFRLNGKIRQRLRLRGTLVEGDLVVTERDGYADRELVPRATQYLVEDVRSAEDLAELPFAVAALRSLDDGKKIRAHVLLPVLQSPTCSLEHEEEMALFLELQRRNPTMDQSQEPPDDPYAGALRLRYGHALTVHKAQGGEWPRVFLDTFVPNTVGTDMRLRWTYTALTRAASEVTLVGRTPIG
jgi:exodeoxyribonuclease-5